MFLMFSEGSLDDLRDLDVYRENVGNEKIDNAILISRIVILNGLHGNLRLMSLP